MQGPRARARVYHRTHRSGRRGRPRSTLHAMLFAELAALSERVAQTRKRSEKTAWMAQAIAALAPDERALAVMYLAGELAQRKLGVGYAQVHGMRDVQPAAEP